MKMEGIITKIKDEALGIKGFYLKVDSFKYVPGQYIMIAFPDDLDSKRAFSIVEFNPQSMEVLILLKKQGDFTKRMFNSGIGQRLEIFGPFGRFTLKQEDKPLVFIAGGIGITPIYSMINHAYQKNFDNSIHLFYTAKSLENMPLYDRLNDVNNGKIKIKYNFTMDKNPQRIDCERIIHEVPYYKDCIFYICGPVSMIQDFRNNLMLKGVPEENIRSEEFT